MEKLATDGMATDTSGNTKQRCLKKRRDWQFTLNEVDRYVELRKYLMGLKSINYMISCKEKALQQDMSIYTYIVNLRNHLNQL